MIVVSIVLAHRGEYTVEEYECTLEAFADHVRALGRHSLSLAQAIGMKPTDIQDFGYAAFKDKNKSPKRLG